jgi:hypothetical protein
MSTCKKRVPGLPESSPESLVGFIRELLDGLSTSGRRDVASVMDSISSSLAAKGLAFSRASRVSSGARVDIFCAGIAICAVRDLPRAALDRMLCRVAFAESVHTILVVSDVDLFLPGAFYGRPVYLCKLPGAGRPSPSMS